MNLNFICKETRGATETKEEKPDVETKPDIGAIASSTINPAIFSLANSFALDRFAGKNAHLKFSKIFESAQKPIFIFPLRSFDDEPGDV